MEVEWTYWGWSELSGGGVDLGVVKWKASQDEGMRGGNLEKSPCQLLHHVVTALLVSVHSAGKTATPVSLQSGGSECGEGGDQVHEVRCKA